MNQCRCYQVHEFTMEEKFDLPIANFAFTFGPVNSSAINTQGLFAEVYPAYSSKVDGH